MKKLILAILAAGTLTTANAQEPKSILLYGDASVSTTRNSDLSKSTNWDVTPGVGYQFNHNWTLGLNLRWGQDAFKDSAANKSTLNKYQAGAFARYSRYIRKSETFFWFAQFGFAYQGQYRTNNGNPATNKANGVYTELYPSIGINVGHGVCLNFNIGGLNYSSMKEQDATNSVNEFNFNVGKQINVGLSKNFNCGHKMHSHHEPGDEVHRRKADKMEDEDDAAPKPKRKQRNRDEDE